MDVSLIKPRKRDYSHNKQETATTAASATASGLPPTDGAQQVPSDGSELKPPDLSSATVWGQNKDHGEAETRREQDKSIDDAGGKKV